MNSQHPGVTGRASTSGLEPLAVSPRRVPSTGLAMTEETSAENDEGEPAPDRILEIERLAALEPIAYEVVRSDAAKRLGLRAHILDREVGRTRRALGLDNGKDEDGQGQAVRIPDVAPWLEPVDGDFVATALAAAVPLNNRDFRPRRRLPFTSLHAAAPVPSKGRLMRCTVLGSTRKRAAILRTPSVRPGAFRAARIRSSRSGAIRGRPSCFPSSLALLSPARTRS
jgi:hypothetical protein